MSIDELKTVSKERVIFIWSVPANGHLNPTLCFTNQLLENLDTMNVSKIVFYSDIAFRDLIINLPNNVGQKYIEFRDYNLQKQTGSENFLKLIMDFDTKPGSLFRMFQCFENSIKLGNKHMFQTLLHDVYNDKPVLILYDQALFFPKMALSLYEKKYKCPMPLNACYVTTFLCARGIYPYWSELSDMGLLGKKSNYHKLKNLSVTIMDLSKYVYTYYKTLWWDNEFTLNDLIKKCEFPFSRNYLVNETLNIVFVLPEVQPRIIDFQYQFSNIKFVGPCVDESVRSQLSNNKYNMDKYVESIEDFLEKNSLDHLPKTEKIPKRNNEINRPDLSGDTFKLNHKPIIYVSMGTVFNNENKHLFQILVDSCRFFADEYSIIISTGDVATYKKYQSMNNDNILFVPHTPQVEILKRAHLFITHAGMNSVSEAIQYGVPIICLPLSGDQPFVAWRVADELGIGIRLQPDKNLTITQVKNSISQILNDPSYRERASNYSRISKQYCGHKNSVQHIINLVCQKETSSACSRCSSTSELLKNMQTN